MLLTPDNLESVGFKRTPGTNIFTRHDGAIELNQSADPNSMSNFFAKVAVGMESSEYIKMVEEEIKAKLGIR